MINTFREWPAGQLVGFGTAFAARETPLSSARACSIATAGLARRKLAGDAQLHFIVTRVFDRPLPRSSVCYQAV